MANNQKPDQTADTPRNADIYGFTFEKYVTLDKTTFNADENLYSADIVLLTTKFDSISDPTHNQETSTPRTEHAQSQTLAAQQLSDAAIKALLGSHINKDIRLVPADYYPVVEYDDGTISKNADYEELEDKIKASYIIARSEDSETLFESLYINKQNIEAPWFQFLGPGYYMKKHDKQIPKSYMDSDSEEDYDYCDELAKITENIKSRLSNNATGLRKKVQRNGGVTGRFLKKPTNKKSRKLRGTGLAGRGGEGRGRGRGR